MNMTLTKENFYNNLSNEQKEFFKKTKVVLEISKQYPRESFSFIQHKVFNESFDKNQLILEIKKRSKNLKLV